MQKNIIAIFIIALLGISFFFLYEKDQPKKVVYKQDNTSQITNLTQIKDNHIKSLKQQSGFSLCEQELKAFNLDLNEISFIYQIKSSNDTLQNISCKKIYEVEKRRLPDEVYNEYLEESVKTEDEILIEQGYYPKNMWYTPPEEIEIDYVDYEDKKISLFDYNYDNNVTLKDLNFLFSDNSEYQELGNIYINIDEIKYIIYQYLGKKVNYHTINKTIYFDELENNDFTKNIQIEIDNKIYNFNITMITFLNTNTNQQYFTIHSQIGKNHNTMLMFSGNLNSDTLNGTITTNNDVFYGFKTIGSKGILFSTKPTKYIRQH